jgi:hypothetical protein
MATVTKGKTFINGDLVTPAALHQLVDSATVSNISNGDLSPTAAIADTKLATIATPGKVANSATTATNLNAANAIVTRDGGGNFSAGTITATLNGTAANVYGTVAVANGGTGAASVENARTNLGLGNSATLNTGVVAGTVATGDHTHAQLHNRSHAITSATDHTAGPWKVFHSDASGQVTELAVGSANAVLTSNGPAAAPSWQTLSATTTNANNLSGGSAGTIPYQSAAGTTAMLSAGTLGQVLRSNGAAAPSWDSFGTSGNTVNAVVQRDGLGNFVASNITANLTGNVTGNVTGTAANVTGTVAVANGGTGATSAAAALTNLGAAASGHTHTDATTTTAGFMSSTDKTRLNGATNANAANAIVSRDASGNFSAGTITASLAGSATSATTSSNLAAGSAGALPYQSADGTTAMLSAGTSGAYLKSNGSAAPSWASVLEPKAFLLVKFTDNSGSFTTLRSQGVTMTRAGVGIYNFTFSPALPQVPLISSTGGREDHIWLDLTTTSATLNNRVFSAGSGSGTYSFDDPLTVYGQHHISFIFF